MSRPFETATNFGERSLYLAERMPRLLRLKKELETETRPHYWEFTERGLNFAYLAPERRARLDEVFRTVTQGAIGKEART